MSALRDRVHLEMRLRGFSPRTVESYIHALKELARFYWEPLDALSCDQVQQFLDEVITFRELAWSTVNVYVSAYRFLYAQVLKRPVHQFRLPPRGRSGKRPGVLSPGDVQKLIAAPPSLKHRALLSLAYGSGLRVSELVRVRIKDVDRGRMMLRVDQGKGRKDRYTVLSRHSLDLLGEYYRAFHRPEPYFFPGRDGVQPISTATALAVYNNAIRLSGVRRVGGIHVLGGGTAGQGGSLGTVLTLVAVFLPVAMIWIAALTARTARTMREESRRLCSEELSACETLLAEVIEREKTSEKAMVRRRDQAASQLQGMHRASQARNSYAAPVTSTISQIDLCSDAS